MSDQNQPRDYYEILGVSFDVSGDEIRRAYRRGAKEWHPDRNKDPNAPRMMRLINEAWDVLGKPERRAEYDRDYFLLRSMIAEAARQAHEEERQERERQQEQERREAAERLRRAEAERREHERREAEQREREVRERRAREEHEWRERERARNVRRDSDRREGVTPRPRERRPTGINGFTTVAVSIILVGVGFAFALLWFNRNDEPANRDPNPYSEAVRIVTVTAEAVDWSEIRALSRSPTATPAVPTPKQHTPPTITIDMIRNGPYGVERKVSIRLGNLLPSIDRQYYYHVSTSEQPCDGSGMGAYTSLGRFERAAQTRSVELADSCTPGTHRLTVKLNRESSLVAQQSALFTILVPTITSVPASTSTPTSAASPTRMPIPTRTPKPSWSGSEIALHNMLSSYGVTSAQVKLLIDAGAPLETQDSIGRKPIEVAAQYGRSTEILELLIRGGAQVSQAPEVFHNMLSSYGVTPAQVKLLIDAGAPLETQDSIGRKPIEVAAQYGRSTEILELLIRGGAQVSQAPEVLHNMLASYGVTPAQVKALIDADAPLETLDDIGRRPIEVAAQYGRSTEILKLLIGAGARVSQAPEVLHNMLASYGVTPAQVKVLINAGAPLETLDSIGRKPIEVATQYGRSTEILELLINAMN